MWNDRLVILPSYDRVVVAFSGGKDCFDSLLWLLEQGVDPAKIELRHHLIDGNEDLLFDWPCTTDYCRKAAASFGVRFLTSWKEGGFRRELLRENARTAPNTFEMLDGSFRTTGGSRGKLSTRRRFPRVSTDLTVRWCSPYLKIDVMGSICRNDPRFENSRTLIVTGERAEESPARANYEYFESDRSDLRGGGARRHIDHLRPALWHTEREVWDRLRRHGVVPHVAYCLGFGRLSCLQCIFGGANQFASARYIAPAQFEQLAAYEEIFGFTVKRDRTLRVLVAKGTPYPEVLANPEWVRQARSKQYFLPVRCDPSEWVLPAGAFHGEACGPS